MRLKTSLPALSALLLVVALAGCTAAAPEPEATTASTDVCAVDSGSASKAVTVQGDLGAEPTVTFDAGLSTGTTQRTEVIEGTGDEIPAGGTATVAYTLYNGTTGAKIDAYGYAEGEAVSFTASVTSVLPGIAKTIGCETVGSRVVSVIAPADAFGDDGYEDLSIAGGDTLVFVMDILSLVPSRADGVDQPAQAGFPTVALADDGTPTVTVPTTTAPTDLQVAVLKKGDGAALAADSTATVQYLGVTYATGEVFDQTWGGTGPTTAVLSELVPGLGQALVGQTVGSQVLVVVPAALAYGTEPSEDNPLAGQTLVYVVDILAVG